MKEKKYQKHDFQSHTHVTNNQSPKKF